MNLNYQELLPENFDGKSKVWIYQASRLLSISEALELEDILKSFVTSWESHGAPVKGYANLFFGQFIILVADETQTTLGGCSTDASQRMIKDIEKLFNISLFDRNTLAFIVKEKVQLIPLNQLSYAVENGFISADTLYFNNTVLTLDQLKNNWLIPVKESWLAKRLSFSFQP